MGRNSIHTMAIIRAGGRATAMTERSREFCSVLKTISASGVVIPPFMYGRGRLTGSHTTERAGLTMPMKLHLRSLRVAIWMMS